MENNMASDAFYGDTNGSSTQKRVDEEKSSISLETAVENFSGDEILRKEAEKHSNDGVKNDGLKSGTKVEEINIEKENDKKAVSLVNLQDLLSTSKNQSAPKNESTQHNISERLAASTTERPDSVEGEIVEVDRLKKLLEEKERQLETAAKYGIGLLHNHEALEALLECRQQEAKLRLEEAKDVEHALRLQLQTREAEHESLVAEARSDLVAIQTRMDEKERQREVEVKALNDVINNLTTTNEALTDQIINMKEMREEMERMLCLKGEECRLLNSSLDSTHQQLSQVKELHDADKKRLGELEAQLRALEERSEEAGQSREERVEEANELSLFAEFEVLSEHELMNGGATKTFLGTQLRQEILEVYRQVQRLVMEVRGEGHLWTPEVVDMADLRAGQLLCSVSTLHSLLQPRLLTPSLPPLAEEQWRQERQMEALKQQLQTSRVQARTDAQALAEVQEQLCRLQHQAQQDHDRICALEDMLKLSREETRTIQAKLDSLLTNDTHSDTHNEDIKNKKDLRENIQILTQTTTHTSRQTHTDIITQLLSQRDQAIQRTHVLEDELMRARVDGQGMGRQLSLLEQQKQQLNEQLQEWQSDMQELIESRMADEMERDSLRQKLPPSPSNPPSNLSNPPSNPPSNPSLSSPPSLPSIPSKPSKSLKKKLSFKWS